MVILRRVLGAYDQGKRSVIKRPFEWMFAVCTLGWGVSLMDPVIETFASPSYIVFKRLAIESTWAALCFYGGLSRLLILWINGSWYRSALLRMFASFSTLTLWFIATTALAIAGTKSTGLYVYATFFVVEFSCMLAAGYEAGRLEMAQYHKLREQVRQGHIRKGAAIVFGVLGVDRGIVASDATGIRERA